MAKNSDDIKMKIIKDLWLKRRDLVSDGYDESLNYLAKIIPLKINKIPTGIKCWTWIVPEKWSVGEAYIEEIGGRRLLDLKNHPLHIISYSLPINKVVARQELLRHITTNPARPKAIPFDFKYYKRDWGFCLPHNRLKEFNKDKYRVVIDSKFEKGSLKIGEYTIKGQTKKTIVLIAHLCHPALVNDDLTGVAVLVDLARKLSRQKNHYTYKFLLVPETIGSIAYLSQNEKIIKDLQYGIFLEMFGNDNIHALQLSRQGDTELDQIARYAMQKKLKNFREGAFRQIICNDEMVFNGPGVNVPTISLSRYPYPEYHTSDDNPGIISEKRLAESEDLVLEIINILDKNYIPKRKFKGPVFLSGYDLWVDWRVNRQLNRNVEQIMLRLEGDKSVFKIAQDLNMDFNETLEYIDKFYKKGLIRKIEN